ncbi:MULTISPECIES: alpha/beta fold hydrolase [Vibrio]|uniref:alpha/beta fold hydrolase n=1 Tax=Vibrio TaxID=662 RepID=UPI000B5CDC23|nr:MULTISPECIES: alpha/beta hydrolase [Vibrio]HBV75550.1 alpha/beta hydrolase [Vibrio sp.]
MRFLLIVLMMLTISACSMPPEIKENKATIERVKHVPNLLIKHNIEHKNYRLHYVSAGKKNKPSIVFVHGTPGGWGTFATYFEQSELLKHFQFFSIDRPGWGQSTYPSGDFPVSLSEQSRLLAPLLKEIATTSQQKVILVGHSYGGSLVPKLAADYPEYVRGILILAGDVGPKLAQARWFNVALHYIPSFLIPDPWYESNKEVLAIAPSLEKSQDQYRSITQPITFLQGTDDELVRPDNANYAKTLFKRSNLEVKWLKDAGHIINLTNVADVVAAIKALDKRSL